MTTLLNRQLLDDLQLSLADIQLLDFSDGRAPSRQTAEAAF